MEPCEKALSDKQPAASVVIISFFILFFRFLCCYLVYCFDFCFGLIWFDFQKVLMNGKVIGPNSPSIERLEPESLGH